MYEFINMCLHLVTTYVYIYIARNHISIVYKYAYQQNIHDLVFAFNLKSISKGNGDARYTTSTKTWKTAVLDVDENGVAKIAKRKNYFKG